MQLFWTDKAGKFPWGIEFDESYDLCQPLFAHSLDFKFFEYRNVATFEVKQIFKEAKPILCVVHNDHDGSWQFLTGDIVIGDDMMVVCLEEVVKWDQTVNELFNLPTGQMATREFIGANWVREVVEEDNEK